MSLLFLPSPRPIGGGEAASNGLEEDLEEDMGYRVAVIGATGNVGREILSMLAERDFPADSVAALASSRSIGKQVSYGEIEILRAQNLDTFDFASTDIVFASAGSEVAARLLPALARACPLVVDNSSHFRMKKEVPLVVPEINGAVLKAMGNKQRLVANPNCSTIIALLALAPLHKLARIRRVHAATYQSVSGAGRKAMDELYAQTKAFYMNNTLTPNALTRRIAFNVIPHIDKFMADGSTKEEWKMAVETKKILDSNIAMSVHCVRVPVFVGHAIALSVECEDVVEIARYRALLQRSAGVSLIDKREDGGYATPVDCVGEDSVFVSRLRKDPTRENGVLLWVVGDNLRKGAALNAVQIAERALVENLL